jgi:tRNA(adenine34) deaminase
MKEADETYMHAALNEAKKGGVKGEVPVGAVVVAGGKVLSRAHNSPISNSDPCAHAEIIALRRAAKRLRNYRLNDASLYVTVEPCLMSAGAISHARISRLVFGAREPRMGAAGLLKKSKKLYSRPEIKSGVLEVECRDLIRGFFSEKRRKTEH